MKIDVDHIARLARLGLSEAEKKIFEEQLSAILSYADILNRIDTANIAATSHAIPMKNVMREDKAIVCPNTRDILANAPEREKNMFKVPKIIE